MATVRYAGLTGQVTIHLSLTEVRQFLSQSVAIEALRDLVRAALERTDESEPRSVSDGNANL